MRADLLLPLPSEPTPAHSACLVLVDLVGSTRLAHDLLLDHYATLMADFVQLMILSFEALGGQVLQHQGDAVLAMWPEAQSAWGVQAALEAHGRAARLTLAAQLGVSLQLRGGVALGQVIAAVVGGQPSAYGLPVNYAKRLCDAAGAGETLVCPNVTLAAPEEQTGTGSPGRPALSYRPRSLPPLPGFGANALAFSAHAAAGSEGQMKTG